LANYDHTIYCTPKWLSTPTTTDVTSYYDPGKPEKASQKKEASQAVAQIFAE